MTLLHWSLEHMFYNHGLLPQLDFLYRQTAKRPTGLCVKSQDDKWHPATFSKLCSLPVCACDLQGLSNALLLLPLHFPAETPPEAGRTSQFKCLWKSKPQCHMCVHGLGKWVTLACMGDIPHMSPHPGQHREPGGENPLKLFLLQLFITNKASLRSGSVVL